MKRGLFIFLSLFAFVTARSQQLTPNKVLPYSFQYYQKFNDKVYDIKTRVHSSIKPFFSDDSLLSYRYKELTGYGTDSLKTRSWVRRKLTDEHLVQFENPEYSVYADFLPDLIFGHEVSESKFVWRNTRGFQVGGNVGSKFSFYANGFENQGVFANYLTRFIDSNKVVPSEMSGKLDSTVKDWAYVTALLSYTPNKYLNFTLGYDKNFIGDGYRSLLLSDVAANSSFFRIRASLGNVQYQTIFSYMIDNGAPRLTNDRRLGARGKWNAMHYLDWNINNRISFGFFQAITWADAEPEGKRGFDFNYIHPFVFLRPIEGANSVSPDKLRLGFNLKYEVFRNAAIYSQFMFDEFTAKEMFANRGYWANKWAAQLGIKGYNLFGVKNFNYLLEFNTARPYTYAHFERISNYSGMSQPLAHPLGANFRELTGIFNYGIRRFDLQLQLLYATYGNDPVGFNYGRNIFLDYYTHVSDYGNKIGQGIGTNLYFTELKSSYLINPKYNLRLEAGILVRSERNSSEIFNTHQFTFGLRSAIRNLYHDF